MQYTHIFGVIEMGDYDCLVLGGGAAGMFASARLGQAGLRVLLVEKSKTLGDKIRISGGGRCNFTNLNTTHRNFVSENPKFALSALARFTPHDFLALVEQYNIPYFEKTKGQLFCEKSAKDILAMLHREMEKGAVEIRRDCEISGLARRRDGFLLETSKGQFQGQSAILATGGKSIPKMGATGIGYQIASQFDLPVTELRAGLVPLTFSDGFREFTRALSGVSCEVDVRAGDAQFRDDILFTHRGLSGPAVLQISNYWQLGTPIVLNFLVECETGLFVREKMKSPKQSMGQILANHLPSRLGDALLAEGAISPSAHIGEIADKRLVAFETRLRNYEVLPNGTEGYRTAEVTLGGVSTKAIDAKRMEVKSVSGLYIIGELIDMTGWLGGYNFQWAWSSAAAATDAIVANRNA